MTKQRNYTLGSMSKIITKNILIIGILTILGAVIGGLYANNKKTTNYFADSTVMINANLNNTDYKNSALLAEKGMMKTYEEIAGNQESMLIAKKYLPKEMRKSLTVEEMMSAVKVNSSPDSLILNFSVKTESSTDSVEIANAVAKAATLILPKYSQNNSIVKVLTRANKKNVNSNTTPSVKKYIVMGASLGLLVGMIFSFSITTWKHM
ncbi:capsular biosynthesis protein [Limosilactobacillus reuteri]|uniref:capsular biosynthesis protein n=2 Tax=Limosilactobacillus reuteri TaxID=1598 RepID=UPI001E39B656|nr:capsular biosynthesis protein [Limosilactobacillus reuteri]MCC4482222.1 capsular biosynthesis protein [Limosilactobacillus reuteri]MDD1379964.1 capsular biosynthesis protein [Limosilactobacillus reuteri]